MYRKLFIQTTMKQYTELKKHLDMNGYDFSLTAGDTNQPDCLYVNEDQYFETITILEDINIKYMED